MTDRNTQEPPMTDHRVSAETALDKADEATEDRVATIHRAESVMYALFDIADAIRATAPKATQDASGDDLSAPQPEPGQVDGYEATGPAKPRSTMRHLAEHDWQEYYETTQTMNSLLARAEKAEAERDAILDELRHLEAQWDNQPNVLQRGAFVRAATQLGGIIDRHTPEG